MSTVENEGMYVLHNLKAVRDKLYHLFECNLFAGLELYYNHGLDELSELESLFATILDTAQEVFHRLHEHKVLHEHKALHEHKSIPFDGIDMSEAEEIEEKINNYVSPCEIELLKFCGVEHGEYSVRVGPVLQVISVSISNTRCPIWNDIKIFGEISVPDKKNNVFYFYKRESDESQLVSPEKKDLVLAGCPMAPVRGGQVKFSLNYLVNNEIRKFKCSGHSHDPVAETSTAVFDGSDGYQASMVFATIPYAVIVYASVFLTFTPPVSENETDFECYGTIKINNVLCFAVKSSNPAKLLSGGKKTYLSQSRYYFAVPLISTKLLVQVSLHNGEGHVLVDESSYIRPEFFKVPTEDYVVKFACEDNRYSLGIVTRWILHEHFFSVWADELNVKRSSDDKVYLLGKRDITDQDFMEVFSVVVVADYLKYPPPICGTILFRDKKEKDYVFARNTSCPDMLERGGTMSLAWPDRCILVDDFYMHLKLKDVCGSTVCRGALDWDHGLYIFDKRLCSFIKGKDGYFVAVHYSLFKSGKRAKFSLKWKGDCSIVYGTVFAEYINYDYSSSYDKENYRIIILESFKDYGVKLDKDVEIPLSKTHVSAPSDCKGLNVHVCLWYHHITNLPYKHEILDKLEFMDNGKTQVKRCGLITVKVKWLTE